MKTLFKFFTAEHAEIAESNHSKSVLSKLGENFIERYRNYWVIGQISYHLKTRLRHLLSELGQGQGQLFRFVGDR